MRVERSSRQATLPTSSPVNLGPGDRSMRDGSSLFARLRLMLTTLLAEGGDAPPPGGPADPYIRVRVPRPGRLPRLDTSVALAEPDEEPELAAVGGSPGR